MRDIVLALGNKGEKIVDKAKIAILRHIHFAMRKLIRPSCDVTCNRST